MISVSLILRSGVFAASSKDGAGFAMIEGAWLYILRRSDGSYYVGTPVGRSRAE